MKQQAGRIIKQGMGGFLCPPGHPTHNQSVQIVDGRRSNDHGSESLEYALTDEMLDDATRACVRAILDSWQKPALDSAEVREWIFHVLGYFSHCYNFTMSEEGWHAGKLTIDREIDPLENADYHAGVHLIRGYYPEYQPTAADFAGAYWGKKPEPF